MIVAGAAIDINQKQDFLTQFAGILSLAHIGKPILSDASCLFDGDLAEPADSRLTALAIVRDVGHHENLASGRRNLEQEPGYDRVAEFVRDSLRPCRAGDGLGEFCLFGPSHPFWLGLF